MFQENKGRQIFQKRDFWDSPICLITDEILSWNLARPEAVFAFEAASSKLIGRCLSLLWLDDFKLRIIVEIFSKLRILFVLDQYRHTCCNNADVMVCTDLERNYRNLIKDSFKNEYSMEIAVPMEFTAVILLWNTWIVVLNLAWTWLFSWFLRGYV